MDADRRDRTPLPPVNSHYRLTRKLGGGGMGVVYEARDLRLDRTVALKFLPPQLNLDEDAKRRFVHEAKAASALDHPNICTIYEIDETDDGRLFIAMAYYKGETLKPKIARGQLPLQEALEYAFQIGEALQRAHEEGIVHRDIKPANVLVTNRGRVKLVDFGIAKVTGVTLTQEDATAGTAAYMSPEQARGDAVDHRTDLWSLGVLLYEMLTGERPFRADYPQALIYSILNEQPAPLTHFNANLPEGVATVVERLLSKDPAGRYQCVEDLMSDLNDLRIAAAPTATPARYPTRRWVAIGVPFILALSVGLWALSRSTTSDRGLTDARSAIAVLPFSVRGDDALAYLRESMVDLLSLKIDGTGALRGIDPNALFGLLGSDRGAVRDLRRGQEIAAQFEAEHFILGAVTRLGTQIRLDATLYDAEGVPQSQVEVITAHENELPAAIDELALKLIAGRLIEPGQELKSIAALTTTSLPAFRAYLDGERLMRVGGWDDAVAAFDRAVEEDSSFALAWYRLRGAIGWSSALDRSRQEMALQKALQHKDELPHRVQQLVMADQAFNRGNAPEAERIYRGLLASNPDDATAWMKLGDVLFHYNAAYGRSTSESREYFERALLYDPGNREALHHLIAMAFKEKDLDVVDSLLTRRYGESWPLGERAIYAVASGDVEQLEAILNELESASERTIRSTSGAVSRRLDNFPVAQRIAEMLTTASRSNSARTWAHRWRGLWDTAQGRLQAADDEYVAAPVFVGSQLVARVMNRMLPFYPVRRVGLDALRQEVVEWDTMQAPLGGPHHAGKHHIIKPFLQGLLSFRMGDEAAVQESIQLLRQKVAEGNDPLAYSLERTLAAHVSWRHGRSAEAWAALDDAHLPAYWAEASSSIIALSLNRYLRAELLFSQGEYEEALPWYESLADVGRSGYAFTYLGPTYLRRAEIYEHRGETDKAIAFYERLVALWNDADPELQSEWVIPARRRLNRLLEDSVREPERVTSPGARE